MYENIQRFRINSFQIIDKSRIFLLKKKKKKNPAGSAASRKQTAVDARCTIIRDETIH